MQALTFWEHSEVPKRIIKTDGYWIQYQGESQPCLDLTTGYGAFLLGYNNKQVLDSMRNIDVQFLRGNSGDTCDQLEQIINTLCSKGNWDSVAWAVSGSDGVEAAIFANDMYWQMTSGYRSKIISFYPGYHGATFISRNLRGDTEKDCTRATVLQSPQWHTLDQRPAAEEAVLLEIRNILENDHKKEYGCLIMETSPWINDMCPWSGHWWKQIRSICDEFGILFILDDVAVCWGKFGTWFGHQNFGVQPDISVAGKALTGGYSPLSAALFNHKVSSVIKNRSFDYNHTWAPNLWGVAASLAVTKIIEENNLLSRVKWINDKIKEIANDFGCISRGDYLFMIMETPKIVTLGDLHNAGLSSGLPIEGATTGHIKFCLPLTVDDEYFHTLKTRLKLIL